MKTIKTEIRKLVDLIPADYNPRKISKQALAGLKKSIEKFGCVQPVIVNKRTGLIVGGHQRVKAMQELGITETEVIVVDLTPSEEKMLNVTLNNQAISGEWTADINAILDEIKIDNEILYDELRLNDARIKEILVEPPDDFKEFDESIEIEHECPRCGYKFSGGKITNNDIET